MKEDKIIEDYKKKDIGTFYGLDINKERSKEFLLMVVQYLIEDKRQLEKDVEEARTDPIWNNKL